MTPLRWLARNFNGVIVALLTALTVPVLLLWVYIIARMTVATYLAWFGA